MVVGVANEGHVAGCRQQLDRPLRAGNDLNPSEILRLFALLEMLDEDEEGIGTRLEINHLSPALEGEELIIEAMVSSLEQHEIICEIKVTVGKRVIAKGVTGQKILKKTKLADLIFDIQQDGRKEE